MNNEQRTINNKILKKTILLTFDYELFLGKRSGTVDNCLIKPTDLLLNILSRHKFQGIFFIDTVYLMRMSELLKDYQVIKEDFKKIEHQLIELIKNGHKIFHHIHPHWLDARYLTEINQWELTDTSKLTFENISDNEREIIMSFSDNFLNQLYLQANSKRNPNGYRAGGLFIEPFECIKPYFEKMKIKYEFSVLPNAYRKDTINEYDFRDVPYDRQYSFSNSLVQEDENGLFTEFPISSFEIKNLNKIINGLYYRSFKNSERLKCYGDGESISTDINKSGTSDKSSFLKMIMPASIEILNPVILKIYKRRVRKNNYFHLLSHPKLLTAESFFQLEKLLKFINKKFIVEKLEALLP